MQTNHYTNVKTQTVNVQGNAYRVRSGMAANGEMEGVRVILSVNDNDPASLSAEELEAIYGRI